MKLAAVISLGVLLSGCATGYHSSGFSGGFSETRMAENIFRVNFKGNGYTSGERAEDMALLRSAELTKQNGFQYFGLADASSSTSTSQFTTPVQSHTTAQATAFGNTAYGSAHTTTSGGQTYFVRKPSASNLVVMFHERPAGGGMLFEASFICGSIGPKYKVVC